ncbi:hypothetical protein OQA88_9750 [Cercophora sp. LCS_1]
MGESKLKPRQRRRLRNVTYALGGCLSLYCFLFLSSTPSTTDNATSSHLPLRAPSIPLTPELLNDLSLGEARCSAAFPGLTKEVDGAVAQGPFNVKPHGDTGPVQGRIKDGQLYIIHAQRKADLSRDMLNSRTAALHQLHRAILTSPSPLPDTIFTLNFQDQPFGTAFTYSRAADPKPRSSSDANRDFLMPHFSFWAWNLPFIGSMSRASAAITSLEAEYSQAWHKKIPKAVWRGTAWFNSVHAPRLRFDLLNTAKGKPWADVETLEWTRSSNGPNNASNALRIEDFCRYKYVLHTEGVTYSGRFQFLQMCKSVVVSPPLQWWQHLTHMVRPVFSSELDLENTKSWKEGKKRWVPTERIREVWPVRYQPEEANMVFVSKDWSDLEDTISWLEEHPKVAEGIAKRQRELFVGGGYFSPAAEACYWRALVRGWAKVAKTEGMGWDELEGQTFEGFVLGQT